MGHPPFMEPEPGESWHLFSDGAWVFGPDGSGRAIVDVELDHGFVETIHAEVVAIFGGSD